MKHLISALLFSALLSFGLFIQSAHAQDIERYTSVSALKEQGVIKAGDKITLATQINLAPHWHVYWRNPGDSGLPVNITWEMPEGFEISDISWPTPEKITYDFLANYGYYNQVVLLQTLTVPNNILEGPITLNATVDMLVCENICIPEQDIVSITLNDTQNAQENDSKKIAAARDALPKALDGTFSFLEKDETLHLEITAKKITEQPSMIEFFPYEWGILNHVAKPDIEYKDNTVYIAHTRGDEPVDQLESIDGILVVEQGNKTTGYKISASPSDAIAPMLNKEENNTETTSEDASTLTWISALYLALFGGLILNLMPCVFPVLSMKALSLVKMGEKEIKQARLHGLSYTIGVILSFLMIGGALIILKETGAAIGWGFQLQNPIVVAALAYLLFSIGLNLIGFFDFDFGLNNVGNKLTQNQSLSGSFFTGALATIVATPCTAPFMGAAMGFAIAQPALISLSVFATLGFGLALPYLLLAYFPILRSVLPKPGAWMNTFKQFLAFPMLASSIWLIWVLDQQSGSYGVLITLLGMLSIAFAIWLSHIKASGSKKIITRTLIIFCLLIPILNLTYISNSSENGEKIEKNHKFGQVFSKESLNEALKAKNPIFVEMTASWCITCKINHATSINIKRTKDLFTQHDIVYFVGDWTNNDDSITEYLAQYNRNGVPIYVFYPAPDEDGIRKNPILLPQVLTPSIVEKTIESNL